MKGKVTEVFIYTREALSEGQFAKLSEQFYESPGIVSISRNIHRPGLFMVVYDAACVQSTRILERVKGLVYQANLIAM